MKKYKARFLTIGNTEIILEIDETEIEGLMEFPDWFVTTTNDQKDWLINLRNICSVSISEIV